MELVSILLQASSCLEALGLRIRLVNGTARLTTGLVENQRLAHFLAVDGTGELSQAALERDFDARPREFAQELRGRRRIRPQGCQG